MAWFSERQKWTSKKVIKAMRELQDKRDELLAPIKDEFDSINGSLETFEGVLRVTIIDEMSTSKRPIHYHDVSFGDWDCEDSPTGYCIYGFYDDYAHDSCIYCGEPDERK